jgi:iron complex outermembrane receptor protein
MIAFADDSAESVSVQETVVVTGSRGAPRSVFDSLSPIDVISDEAIESTPSGELVEAMATLVPSFSVQTLPALDGTIFVRPARLRNLSPDQTLVLLNGKRMHRSAMMMNPSYGSAFQAPDLDQVAPSALKSIEVLRDGAAAQYGSDAIAGVINLNLSDSDEFKAFAQWGSRFAGDGDGVRIGLQGGYRTDNAFITISGETIRSNPTSRSQKSSNVIASQAAYPDVEFPEVAVRWGLAEREAFRIAVNSGLGVNGINLYAFGTYGKGSGSGDFNYRGPAGSYASIFDTNPAFPGWSALDLYPAGFTPIFQSDDEDSSAVIGAKKEFGSGLTLDLSTGYGSSRIDYSMRNSINASLGPNSPTSFYDGSVEQIEKSVNLDASYPVSIGLYEAATLAGGLEHRSEEYSIIPGDQASWEIGPGSPGLPCCSNGFPGYAPVNSGTYSQDSHAAYADLLLPLTESFSTDLAVRYEDFSTFGESFTYKLSSRYEFTPSFAVRGSLGTGFRAPTPAQTYSEGISQFLPSASATITTAGRFSPIGLVAQLLNNRDGVNIEALKAEKSRNYSLGLVWNTDFGLSTTVDIYEIVIKDRLSTTPYYVLTADENAALSALNIPNLQAIYYANFLQNDYDTKTKGIDIVSTYQREMGAGTAAFSAAVSYIDTSITGGSRSTNPYSKRLTEDALPKARATISADYNIGGWGFTTRARYYGEWSDWQDTFPNTATPGAAYPKYDPQVFGDIVFFDISAKYDVTEKMSVRVGADNVFDTYPDRARWQTFRGLVYSRNTPYSTDGGYYYARVDYAF